MRHAFALLLAAAATAAAQSTHVAMDGLLSLRYFPQRAEFMIAQSIPVLFPPPGETKARIVIKKAGGGVAVAKDMIIEPWPPHNAFGNLKPADGRFGFGPIAAGDYTFSVEMNGKEISSYPFSVKLEKGTDPFEPGQEYVRSGPWSKTAYLIGPINDTGYSLDVGIWLSTREFPGYAPKRKVPITMHLLNGTRPVGLIEGVVSDGNWEFFRFDMRQGHGLGPVKWAALLSQPGAYTLELRAEGKSIRTYKFQVAGGAISRIASNEVNYDGVDALPAQSLIKDSRVQEYWLAPIR